MLDLLNEAWMPIELSSISSTKSFCLAKFESLWRGYCAKYFLLWRLTKMFISFSLVRCVFLHLQTCSTWHFCGWFCFVDGWLYYNRGFLPCLPTDYCWRSNFRCNFWKKKMTLLSYDLHCWDLRMFVVLISKQTTSVCLQLCQILLQ